MVCTIEAKVLPLAHLGGHLYLEVFNDEGKRIAQINGLSVSSKTNEIIPIGRPWDNLKAYVSNNILLAGTRNGNRDSHPHKGYTVCSGTKDEVENAVRQAAKLAKTFNDRHFLYGIFNFNSNTVFSAMLHEVGKTLTVDHEAVNKAVAMRSITPGIKQDLITHKQSIDSVFKEGRTGTRQKPSDAKQSRPKKP